MMLYRTGFHVTNSHTGKMNKSGWQPSQRNEGIVIVILTTLFKCQADLMWEIGLEWRFSWIS